MEKTTQERHRWERHGLFRDTAHRAYHCATCEKLCKICSYCDRGNVYCHECAPKMRTRRKRIADKRYRSTNHGKGIRCQQSRRRYKRRTAARRAIASQKFPLTLPEETRVQNFDRASEAISKAEKDILGDRGSPSEQSLECVNLPALEPTEGKSNEETIRIVSLVAKKNGGREAIRANVFCEFCGRGCSEFRRRLGRSRMDRRRLQIAKTPRDGPRSYGGGKL